MQENSCGFGSANFFYLFYLNLTADTSVDANLNLWSQSLALYAVQDCLFTLTVTETPVQYINVKFLFDRYI